jgi:hypothetical protein
MGLFRFTFAQAAFGSEFTVVDGPAPKCQGLRFNRGC